MSAGRTILRNVRVFDGHRFLAPGTVLIDGAVVGDPTIVPAGTDGTIHVETVDAEGGVLIPGLIDAPSTRWMHPRSRRWSPRRLLN